MSVVTTDGTVGGGLKKVSASCPPDTNVKGGMAFSILVDLGSCIGCKACEVACAQWHDLKTPIPAVSASFAGYPGYQSHNDLAPNVFMLMKFREGEADNKFHWFINKVQCMHCGDPGCLKACPAPGAVIQYNNGVVDFDQSKCIGCKMCLAGCPFNVPRYDANSKPWKCNFCVDRVASGLEPACAKTCPSGCMSFGSAEDMRAKGKKIVASMQKRGFKNAALYDPQGVNGTTYIYALPHGDKPEMYGLPANPEIPPMVHLWKGGLKWLGGFAIAATIAAALLHFITAGPIKGKEHRRSDYEI